MIRMLVAAAFGGSLLGSNVAAAPVVRPTADAVPVNLLRFSVIFDHPPEGPVLKRIALTGPEGVPIDQPFLDQELWSPDGHILTVLMHPGRVKTGLVANEHLGRALADGQRVIVTFDGRPIKTWRVTNADIAAPDPSRWQVSPPPPRNSRDALTVRLDGPVDALGKNLIAIRTHSGERLEGKAVLQSGEAIWQFTPKDTWSVGRYAVVAAPDLEDLAGNRPGLAFEHETGANATFAEGPTFEIGGPSNSSQTTTKDKLP